MSVGALIAVLSPLSLKLSAIIVDGLRCYCVELGTELCTYYRYHSTPTAVKASENTIWYGVRIWLWVPCCQPCVPTYHRYEKSIQSIRTWCDGLQWTTCLSNELGQLIQGVGKRKHQKDKSTSINRIHLISKSSVLDKAKVTYANFITGLRPLHMHNIEYDALLVDPSPN